MCCKKRRNLCISCISSRRGRFLMWFPSFIYHRMDAIGAGFPTWLQYWQQDNSASTAGSEKGSVSGGTNRLCLHPKKCRILRKVKNAGGSALSTRRDDAPSCLFNRYVAPCRTLSISSPAWKTHTALTVRGRMRLLTCRNQTMANVSLAQITFTIGVSSLSLLMHCGTVGLYSAGLGGGRTD